MDKTDHNQQSQCLHTEYKVKHMVICE